MTTTERTLPLLRWSSVVRCPRQAVYAATNAPARDRSEKEERVLWRGRNIGREYVELLQANHGEENVRAEMSIQWFGGVGHMDALILSTGTAVEVLSSVHATDEMRHVKLLQLCGYMTGCEEAKNGCLVVIDPRDFSEDRTVVIRGTTAWEALVEECEARVAEIRRYAETGELPERVCRKPNDAIGMFCTHADYCFTGWEPPDPVSVASDPETVELARRWRNEKQREREVAAVVKEHEERRKEIEGLLSETLEQPGEHVVGPFTVKRVDVRRRPVLDFRKAVLAGAISEEVVEPYMKPGASYSTWSVEDGADGEIDYGEAPF